MSREKIDVNEFVDSKSEGSLVSSDIIKALEDIDYDINDSNPDELESEDFKEIENDEE